MKLLRYVGFLLALFGAVGFATSAHAALERDPKAKDLILKGDAKCTGCHDEADEPSPSMLELHPSVLAIGATRHGNQADGRTPTCTNCHGDSEKHIGYKGKDKPPVPDRTFRKNTTNTAAERNEACLTCHEKDRKRAHWSGSQHETADVACASCHNVHAKKDKVLAKVTQAEVCYTCHKTERAQSHKMSTHPLDAGKMACSDCHNPHGSIGPKLLVKKSVNETCYTCHAEKRGPFLFEHEPVADDCTTCHTPHGSTNTALLKARLPFLCQQCHQDHGSTLRSGRSLPGAGNLTTASPIGNYRGCANCHAQVHGSNSPGGVLLNR